MKTIINCFLILVLISLNCCQFLQKETRFQLLSSQETGITFNNLITESDSLNVLKFEYIYNGAGVGVGDVNNDGLTDIFFAGNMVSSKLYLNKGNFKFEDITEKAGVTTKLWCTGVAMADVNQDGLLDMYISTVHPNIDETSPNLLFLNKGLDSQGIPKFEEVAEKVGLADKSYSTQAAFLDYDLDGDLDMYLLTNAIEVYHRNTAIGQQSNGKGKSVDKLFRNDSPLTPEGGTINSPKKENSEAYQQTPPSGVGGLRFTDVSKEAGILTEGWGLGIVVSDLNQDSYPDVYVANDFLTNDHLYLNNRNGTFTNQIKTAFRHTEFNGMGTDIGDINNDGLNDIVVTDMMPDDNLRQKTMFSSINYDRFLGNIAKNYLPQYTRNVLQLNNGNGTFSEIGYLSGIYATDWSWSALFADFDNDGFRDLLITNGYKKDITDLDFVSYNKSNSMFGKTEDRYKKIMEETNKLKGVKKINFLFKNNGDLTFTNQAQEWGLTQPSYTNGAAYADFDNDGDLDLVMNNINDEAFVYKNNSPPASEGGIIDSPKKENSKSPQQTPPSGAGGISFLRLKLSGEKGNLQGFGAKVWIYNNGKIQFSENNPQRGYKSSVEPILHFGLGNATKIDSLKIIWQSGKSQILKNVPINQVLTLKEMEGRGLGAGGLEQSHYTPLPTQRSSFFNEVSKKYNLLYKHEEEDFVDFKIQATLPHKHSQLGPGLVVGDLNNDGLDDIFIGGSAHKKAAIFYQKPDNTFRKTDFLEKISEDTGVLLFDADNDSDLDIYCVSGSSEFLKNTQYYQDRLYKNLGNGKFELDTSALPSIISSGSVVTANDFDKDGDLDLFVGGRVIPSSYPIPPQSYLLQNNGRGKFTDITQQTAGLQRIGMVTAAIWTDYDNDGWPDLMLTGEFMPIVVFKNEKGKLVALSGGQGARSKGQNPSPFTSVGFWNSLVAGDFDNDGDMDYVAGNLGRNSFLQASDLEPVCVYAKDFDENGLTDPILCHFLAGKEYPVHPRETMTTQLVSLRRPFKTYAEYGKMTFPEIFSEKMLKNAIILKSNFLQSAYIENLGNGNFNIKALPIEVQFSPVFGMLVKDIDEDGNLDLLTVGNDHSNEVLSGWYDAGIGNVLKGDGKGNFTPLKVTETGFFVHGDAKAFAEINLKNGKNLLLISQNQDSLKVFEQRNTGNSKSELIKLQPDDAFAEIIFKDGKKRKQEFYFGNGYLSQSSRTFDIFKNVKEIIIVNTKGNRRKVSESGFARF